MPSLLASSQPPSSPSPSSPSSSSSSATIDISSPAPSTSSSSSSFSAAPYPASGSPLPSSHALPQTLTIGGGAAARSNPLAARFVSSHVNPPTPTTALQPTAGSPSAATAALPFYANSSCRNPPSHKGGLRLSFPPPSSSSLSNQNLQSRRSGQLSGNAATKPSAGCTSGATSAHNRFSIHNLIFADDRKTCKSQKADQSHLKSPMSHSSSSQMELSSTPIPKVPSPSCPTVYSISHDGVPEGTGSGKPLAALLAAIDHMATTPPNPEKATQTAQTPSQLHHWHPVFRPTPFFVANPGGLAVEAPSKLPYGHLAVVAAPSPSPLSRSVAVPLRRTVARESTPKPQYGEEWLPTTPASTIAPLSSPPMTGFVIQGAPTTPSSLLHSESPATPTKAPRVKAEANQQDEIAFVAAKKLRTRENSVSSPHHEVDNEADDYSSKRKRTSVQYVTPATVSTETTTTPSSRRLSKRNQAGKFQCEWSGCGKCFTTSGHLARHARIHTGVFPYKCLVEDCNKRFTRQDNMIQHYRSHVGSCNAVAVALPKRSTATLQTESPPATPPASSAVPDVPVIASDGLVQLFNRPQQAAEFWLAVRSSAATASTSSKPAPAKEENRH